MTSSIEDYLLDVKYKNFKCTIPFEYLKADLLLNCEENAILKLRLRDELGLNNRKSIPIAIPRRVYARICAEWMKLYP